MKATITEGLSEFLLDQKARLNSPKTIRDYREKISLWMQSAGENTAICDVSRHDMRQYVASLNDRNLARDTVRSYIRALRVFWAFVSAEYGIPNAMQSIKEPTRQKPKPKGVKESDFIKLFESTRLDNFGIRDRAILAMFADTGARLGAIASMTVDCVDVIRRTAIVNEKGNEEHTIYWTHYTNMLLDKWLKARPYSKSSAVFLSLTIGRESEALTKSGIYQIFKRLKTRAGVTGRCNPHAFRHNFATRYLISGGDIATLSKILNHKDIKLTSEYYAIFDDRELSQLHNEHSPLLKMLEMETS